MHQSLVNNLVVTCDEIADRFQDFNYMTPETLFTNCLMKKR